MDVPAELSTLVSRLDFISRAGPGDKPVFGKHNNLKYINASDVLRNKVERRWWNWQDADTNSTDISRTLRQGREFLERTPVTHAHYELVLDVMNKTPEGLRHLINTFHDHAITRATIMMCLAEIDKLVAASREKIRIHNATAAGVAGATVAPLPVAAASAAAGVASPALPAGLSEESKDIDLVTMQLREFIVGEAEPPRPSPVPPPPPPTKLQTAPTPATKGLLRKL